MLNCQPLNSVISVKRCQRCATPQVIKNENIWIACVSVFFSLENFFSLHFHAPSVVIVVCRRRRRHYFFSLFHPLLKIQAD